MSITHIVLLQFKPLATAQIVQAACERFLALKTNCLQPDTNQPYIESCSGGRDNSPEGAQGGFTHAFVVKFANAADRHFYVYEDLIHKEFVRSLDGLVEKALVLDFTDGSL